MYRKLESDLIIQTADTIGGRVKERFPEAGLSEVAQDVLGTAKDAHKNIGHLARPNWPLRILNGFLVATIAVIGIYVVAQIVGEDPLGDGLSSAIELLEPALSSAFFIGAFVLFVWTLEVRRKRARALAWLHELRSLAHVIDMHQLTKDPGRVAFRGKDTESSPERLLSPFELSRYLDYCSELLSIIGKVSALYAQGLADAVVLDAVDQIEALTDGLSRKVWNKVSILDRYLRDAESD